MINEIVYVNVVIKFEKQGGGFQFNNLFFCSTKSC